MNKHMELYYTNIKHQCMKSCKTKQIHNKFIEQKTKFETKHYKSLKFMAKVGQAKKNAKSCPGVVPELSRSCPGVVPEGSLGGHDQTKSVDQLSHQKNQNCTQNLRLFVFQTNLQQEQ